jgi:hypothetical protein
MRGWQIRFGSIHRGGQTEIALREIYLRVISSPSPVWRVIKGLW